jgi:hypothetical protein
VAATNQPDGYNRTSIFYLRVFTTKTTNGLDSSNQYLKDVLMNGTKLPYLKTVGTTTKDIDDADRFTIVYPGSTDEDSTPSGYLASVNEEDNSTNRYFGDKPSDLKRRKFVTLQTINEFPTLKSDKLSIATDFSIEFGFDSPLFPFASILQFKNPAIEQCDQVASFCIGDHAQSELEMYFGSPPQKGCDDVFLVVECVTPNCFVTVPGNQCSASR